MSPPREGLLLPGYCLHKKLCIVYVYCIIYMLCTRVVHIDLVILVYLVFKLSEEVHIYERGTPTLIVSDNAGTTQQASGIKILLSE